MRPERAGFEEHVVIAVATSNVEKIRGQSKFIRRNRLRHSVVFVCSLVCHYGCVQLCVMGLPQR